MSTEAQITDVNQVLMAQLKSQNRELAEGYNQAQRERQQAVDDLKAFKAQAARDQKLANLKIAARTAECRLLRYLLRQARKEEPSRNDD